MYSKKFSTSIPKTSAIFSKISYLVLEIDVGLFSRILSETCDIPVFSDSSQILITLSILHSFIVLLVVLFNLKTSINSIYNYYTLQRSEERRVGKSVDLFRRSIV